MTEAEEEIIRLLKRQVILLESLTFSPTAEQVENASGFVRHQAELAGLEVEEYMRRRARAEHKTLSRGAEI